MCSLRVAFDVAGVVALVVGLRRASHSVTIERPIAVVLAAASPLSFYLFRLENHLIVFPIMLDLAYAGIAISGAIVGKGNCAPFVEVWNAGVAGREFPKESMKRWTYCGLLSIPMYLLLEYCVTGVLGGL